MGLDEHRKKHDFKGTAIEALRVRSEIVRLVKLFNERKKGAKKVTVHYIGLKQKYISIATRIIFPYSYISDTENNRRRNRISPA